MPSIRQAYARGQQDVLNALGVKAASVVPLLPQIIMPAVGGFVGKHYGGDIGALAGSITGGVGGAFAREALERNMAAQQQSQMNAQLLPPTQMALDPSKQASGDSTADLLGGDVLGAGWQVGKGALGGDTGQGVRNAVGQTAGILGGGLLGHAAGVGLNKLVGHDVNVPLANIPLSTLLAGIGSTIGSVHGYNLAQR